jgi:hypothetical protein
VSFAIAPPIFWIDRAATLYHAPQNKTGRAFAARPVLFPMAAGLSRHPVQSAALTCFFPATMDSMFSPNPFATPVP